MRLTLFCEHSRWPVHALSPGPARAGVYELDVPREWWVKLSPLLKVTSALLKPFLGVGLAAAELGMSDAEWSAVEEQLALAQQSMSAAIEAAETVDGWAQDDVTAAGAAGAAAGVPKAFEGAALRWLHETLREKDPTFADLRRVRDPSGRYLWVHPRFVRVYDPGPPEIPLPAPQR
jgi:hypothetical protein